MPRRLRISFLCALALAVLAVPLVQAQQTLRIAAVVNDEVISLFDLTERIKVVLFSSGIADSVEQRQRLAPRVLATLIDETLQLQEAKQLNIEVTQRDLATAYAELEERNNIPEGQLEAFLARNGVSLRAVEEQLRATIAWQKVLSRRVVPTVSIGQDEIDGVLGRIEAAEGQTQYRVAEIVLAIEQPQDEPEVMELANRLIAQMREGAAFPAVAQQFSQSASAAVGGDLGWVLQGQLDPDLDFALAKARPGQIIGPVRTPDGVQILQLVDRRADTGLANGEVSVSLRQFLLAVADGAEPQQVEQAVARAEDAAADAGDCNQFARIAEQLGTNQPSEPARLRLADLSPQLRQVVDGLSANQVSQPVITPYGVQVVMVCDRDRPEANGPNRDAIAEQIARERIDMLARRYIRDLRRSAFIELRI